MFFSLRQGEVGFLCCVLQGPKTIVGKETTLITERISRVKLGEASVMKKVPQCTRGPYESAWQCLTSLDEWER